jgi:hypothetical protein
MVKRIDNPTPYILQTGTEPTHSDIQRLNIHPLNHRSTAQRRREKYNKKASKTCG